MIRMPNLTALLSLVALGVCCTPATGNAAITFSIANYSGVQGAAVSSVDIDVLISRDGANAADQIVGATIGFAVQSGDGTSGAIVLDPPTTFSGSWASTVWNDNPNFFFSATPSVADDVDQATTNVLNGTFGPGFSAVDADGLLARYTVDFSALGPGVYSLTPSLSNAGQVTRSDFSSLSAASSAGTMTITAAAVPEPGSLAILGLVSSGMYFRHRRRQVS
ncbi:MAG: PEP-CTERM sorting domain-containing protein [Rhodopirellula sp. JB053]